MERIVVAVCICWKIQQSLDSGKKPKETQSDGENMQTTHRKKPDRHTCASKPGCLGVITLNLWTADQAIFNLKYSEVSASTGSSSITN